MKKILLSAAAALLATTAVASAADLAMKSPMMVAAPVYSWTGFYLGANVGAGWGTTETSLTAVGFGGGGGLGAGFPIDQNSKSGVLGGGQIGYNFQSGWAVFGVQADFAGTDINGTTPCLGGVASCTGTTHWLATASGRIGGLVNSQTLLYVKGGGAWMNSTHSLTIAAGGGGGIGSLSANNTASGYLLGFGTEYAFSHNWTGFIEYDYMGFSAQNVNFSVLGVPVASTSIVNKLSTAKVGVNYKF